MAEWRPSYWENIGLESAGLRATNREGVTWSEDILDNVVHTKSEGWSSVQAWHVQGDIAVELAVGGFTWTAEADNAPPS